MLTKDELDAIAAHQDMFREYIDNLRLEGFGGYDEDKLIEMGAKDIPALLQHIRELEAVVTGIAKSEPIDYDSYSKCTYCGGGMSLAHIKNSPFQDHKLDCPWLKAKQLVTPQAGAGGGD